MRASRYLALVLVAVALAACAPVFAPHGPGPTPAKLTETSFVTSDGLKLPLRRWGPQDAPKAIVVALHGFNDYAIAFDSTAAVHPGTGPYLAAQGFAVYAYDQRGFGAAPSAGLWPGESELKADVRDFVALLRQEHPGVPIFGLGESMGGAVLMAAVAESATPFVDGLILAAPAVWARSTMPLPYRVALWFAARLAPGAKPSGRGFGVQASDNIDLLRQNAKDPLFIKDTRIDSIYGVTNLMDDALEAAARVRVPTLYLYGEHDQLIPKRPTREAIRRMAQNGAPLRVAYYPKGWHILLRDRQAETVLADVAVFVANPAEPLPSGADDDALERLSRARETGRR
jgi:acylglycerol lipase